MAGYNHLPHRDVNKTIILMRGRIAEEDTWCGARCMFLGVMALRLE
jgi:hypothetical protein